MLNLRVRTSYSFGKVFGPVHELINTGDVLAITDFNTFGYHYLDSLKRDKKIIYGIELNIVKDFQSKSSNSIFDRLILLAKNIEGVKLIYKLTTLSYANKGWFNRISIDSINDLDNVIAISTDVDAYLHYVKTKLIKCDLYFGLANTFNYFEQGKLNKIKSDKLVAISDNLYFKKEDEFLYTILATNASIDGKNSNWDNDYDRRWLLSEEEWREQTKNFINENKQTIAIKNTWLINDKIESFEFEKAHLPDIDRSVSLLDMCKQGAIKRKIDLEQEPYKSRLEEELDVIYSKELFIDYFYIVADLVNWAKQQMLVGPGRGSGGGSLVCYLLGITDFDPIPYGLYFSRFLDKNRKDYPDIDIDFESFSPVLARPNRDDCITYLESKYGIENTGRVGRLLNIKGKSLHRYLLPFYKIEDYINSFTDNVDDGKDKIENTKYVNLAKKLAIELKRPEFEQIYRLYGLPTSSGIHPSGIIVANKNLLNYQTISFVDGNKKNVNRTQERQLMIDIQDTDRMQLLKIDCLSLETLTIIHNCLNVIGKTRDWLLELDYEDKKVYDSIFKTANTVGVFQFEGKELQEVCKTIGVKCFEDITACTSIARPASLRAGNAYKYRDGNIQNIKSENLRKVLEVTRGVIIYQEQLMAICRECFKASFELVNRVRKTISKSKGQEAMKLCGEELFEVGRLNNVPEKEMKECWNVIAECGSYLFNKAHATAYSYITYWTAYLKTHYPFEYLISILNSTDDVVKSSNVILYMMNNNHKVKFYDKQKSTLQWTVDKETNTILGPLTVLKGISFNKGKEIIKDREKGVEFKPGAIKIFESNLTRYNFILDFKNFWNIIENRWMNYFNNKPIKDIDGCDKDSTIVFYLIDKLEKVSAKGTSYLSLRVYNGYQFSRLIYMDKEGESTKWKNETYYVGTIQGVFLKHCKTIDINIIKE